MNEELDMELDANSNQLVADDLVGGPRIITITAVAKSEQQKRPIAIYYDGDQDKPWCPCLSMRRVIVMGWGQKVSSYVGRKIQLFRDENVWYGDEKTGGIRISHMSDIQSAFEFSMLSRRKRTSMKIDVLKKEAKKKTPEEIEAALSRDAKNALMDTCTKIIDAFAVGDENSAYAAFTNAASVITTDEKVVLWSWLSTEQRETIKKMKSGEEFKQMAGQV